MINMYKKQDKKHLNNNNIFQDGIQKKILPICKLKYTFIFKTKTERTKGKLFFEKFEALINN